MPEFLRLVCGRFRLTFETELLPALTTQTLAPSKAAPSGNCPTGNVPVHAPSLALTLVTVLLLQFRDPDVGAIENSLRQASHRKSSQDCTRGGERLGDVAASLIGHPQIHSIEGNPWGEAPTGNVPMTQPSDARTFVNPAEGFGKQRLLEQYY